MNTTPNRAPDPRQPTSDDVAELTRVRGETVVHFDPAVTVTLARQFTDYFAGQMSGVYGGDPEVEDDHLAVKLEDQAKDAVRVTH